MPVVPAALPTPWRNRIVGYDEVDPRQLLANPWNAHRHTAYQHTAVLHSLDTLGWIKPVVENVTTGHMIDGHERVWLALQRDEPTVPRLLVDLTVAEEKQALAWLDASTGLAFWDGAMLHALQEDGVDLGAFWRADELAALLAGPVELPAPGDGGDAFDATPNDGPTRCALGDVWRLGPHRLMIGDSTNPQHIAQLLDGNRPALLLLDPPYGMRLDADFSGMKNHLAFAQEKGVKAGRKYDNVIGDHTDFDASFLTALFEDVAEQLWFGADYYAGSLSATEHSGAWLVWDKRLDENADKMYGSCFELIWSRQKHKRDLIRHKWAGIFGTEHEPQRGRQHPNQKPVRLYEDLLTRYSKDGVLVADFFAGSGTSLVAAHRTARCVVMMEIAPQYGDVILRRAEAEGIGPIERIS